MARIALCAAAMLRCAEAADHGGAPPAPAPSPTPEAAPTPDMGLARPLADYQPGPELKGFDIGLLRSTRRVHDFRYPLKNLRTGLLGEKPMALDVSVSIELSNESGIAEVRDNETFLRAVLTDLMSHADPPSLLSVAGKAEMKERIVRTLNERLKTSRVRQVYFTHFFLSGGE
jgi:hypothetical protein